MALTHAQQLVASTLDKPVFVAAGAGSGKTFTLTQRVVGALLPGSAADGSAYLEGIDQALVITFTEKAAGEIKERLRAELRRAGLADEALKVDSAWVSTIHGMCSRILHAHALSLGLDPQFVVLGEHRTQRMRDDAVERVLAEASREQSCGRLFEEYGPRGGQLQGDGNASVAGMLSALLDAAAAAPDGFDSIVAPGEPADVSPLLADLASCYQALAAQPSKYEDQLAAAAHNAALLEDYLATTPPARRTPQDASRLLDGLAQLDGRRWRAKAVSEAYRELVSTRALADAEFRLAAVAPLREPLLALAQRAQAYYEQAKAQARGLDNDDLLRLTLDALRDKPAIAAEYCGRFRLVMVDEFQDTSSQQVEMVKLLSGDGAFLTTVGDAQQSIYRFRGADVGVFRARLAEAEEDPGALVVSMDQNFRSHDDILRVVQRVCDQPSMIADFMDLRDCPTRADGLAGIDLPRVQLELVCDQTKRGEGAASSTAERVAVSAAQVADRLRAFADAGVSPSDMAVLLGRMSNAGLFVEALRARGLDCVVSGGSTFAAAPEVQEVAALLRTFANPGDTQDGLFPVLAGELFCVSVDDLVALRTTTHAQTGLPASAALERSVLTFAPYEGLGASPRLQTALEVLRSAFERLGSEPVADLLLQVCVESGWLARLEAAGVSGRARAANVLAALRHVRELTAEMGLGVARASQEFDHWLQVAKEGPASLVGGETPAVRLMTVHASKGLEFGVVAVAECCNDRTASASGLLLVDEGATTSMVLRPKERIDLSKVAYEDLALGEPRSLAQYAALLSERDHEEDVAEQARLLYVALTRAREALVLSLPVKKLAKRRADGTTISPRMAEPIVGALLGDFPEAGEATFGYGGSRAGVVRMVLLTGAPDGVLTAQSGGTLAGFDGALAVRGELALCRQPGVELGQAEDDADARVFVSYARADEPRPASRPWTPREGVYSYSSARARLEAAADPLPLASAEAEEELADDEPLDADRATNLGSALHICCQRMVEMGLGPEEALDPAAVDAIGDACGISERQRVRLHAALARWTGCSTRREALARGLVRAEVPFFVPQASDFGELLVGAIDLLASDGPAAHGQALVVDYKTGELDASYEAFAANHAMQARFYARVLLDLGFTAVTCVFVAVERDDPERPGEPLEARYAYTAKSAPPLF